MSETRPSGHALVPNEQALVTQELAEIDSRGRLHILPRWMLKAQWPAFPAAGDFEALAVLTVPGRASLMPWKPEGPRIVERYQKITQSSDGPDFEALRMFQDRYIRLALPRDRRLHLGDAVLQHIGLTRRRELPINVYVAVTNGLIDLLGSGYRNRLHREGHPSLDGLP